MATIQNSMDYHCRRSTMVRTCKRKTKRQSWKEENMKKAIDAVENEMVVRAAATNFDVAGMALKPHQQAELLEYIFDMETCMYGLTPRDVRCVAFQLAEINNIKHPFSKTKQAAGKTAST
ncbi:hypothetical protein QE152_g39108 [Popillia japonica]|uniref:Uncharacterized protein n=1 Tax=Popillia japonica TaxID=7064 RepID=A0AAW1HV26_POPJA